MNKFNLLNCFVLVKWNDARGVQQDWVHKSVKRKQSIALVHSAGYLTIEKKDFIEISPHVAFEKSGDYQTCGDMTIPKSAIVSIREIRMEKPKRKKKKKKRK